MHRGVELGLFTKYINNMEETKDAGKKLHQTKTISNKSGNTELHFSKKNKAGAINKHFI